MVRRVEKLRAQAVPAPQVTVESVGTGVLLVLQHLPGQADPPITRELIDHLLTLQGLQAGLADGPAEPWRELMAATLLEGLDGYCEHGSLRDFSTQSQALLDRILGTARTVDWSEIPSDDLVHYDFHPSNILATGGQVTGIVDWDAVQPGDLTLDLAMLTFTCAWRAESDVLDHLWTAFLSHGDEQRRTVAMHHTVLRLVDWFLRHNTPTQAQVVLEHGIAALDRLERS